MGFIFLESLIGGVIILLLAYGSSILLTLIKNKEVTRVEDKKSLRQGGAIAALYFLVHFLLELLTNTLVL
jgi:hypothetical protein